MNETLDIAFRATRGPLWAPITVRARDGLSPSLAAKRDLERYYGVVAASMPEVRAALGGEAGANLVCDALNGIWLGDSPSVGLAWAEIAEHVRLNDAAAIWGMPRDAADDLVQRVRHLSPGATAALVDAVETWWHDESGDDAVVVLARVGLIEGGTP